MVLFYSIPRSPPNYLLQFIDTVKSIYESLSTLHHNGNDKLLFRFEYTKEAALHNAIVLQSYNFDLNLAIQAQQNSQVFYGSEFHPINVLSKLLDSHPLWRFTISFLSDGATYPLQPVLPSICLDDIKYRKDRGNHKSASKFHDVMSKMIQEDAERGFALPLPIEILPHIPNASLAPLGCHEQTSINASGEQVPKLRLTLDQSFPGPSGTSVNLRVDSTKLPPIMYGFCLKRIIHYILDLRQRHPTTKIFNNKFDYDAAYRCCHLSSTSAQESLTIHDNFLLMALRLTFGGSACPNLWNCLSESRIDIANMLIQNPFWDHRILFDPLSSKLDSPDSLPTDIPFAQAKDLAVLIPVNDISKVDIYIDDTIGIASDKDDNVNRVSAAIPLAIHAIARPLDSLNEIPLKEKSQLKDVLLN